MRPLRGQETLPTVHRQPRCARPLNTPLLFARATWASATACTCSTMRSSRTSTTYRFAMVYDHQANWPRGTSPWRWRRIACRLRACFSDANCPNSNRESGFKEARKWVRAPDSPPSSSANAPSRARTRGELRIGHLEQSFKAAVRREQGQGLLNGSFRRQLTGLAALS